MRRCKPQEQALSAIKTVQLGQSVEPGVRLMSLVTTPVWVYANFKETQLAKMQVGQVAEIEVDALKGQSISRSCR